MNTKNTLSGPGGAVDKNGNHVVDPTPNVLLLVDAAVKRLDDLRACDSTHLKEMHTLESKRIDDLRAAESRRIDEQQKLHADYHDKLSLAEAKRIDAIRAVDVAAVAVASERAGQQASVLANQVAASADALRALVATTADTMAKAQNALTTQFTDRIATLEKSSYEGVGRQRVADPALAELITEMKGVVRTQFMGAGKTEGIGTSWGVLINVIGLIITAAAIVIAVVVGNKSAPAVVPGVAPAPPQIIYVPAPVAPVAAPGAK